MAPTPTISPISSSRIHPRAGITYWATAPAGYFSTYSFSEPSSITSASTASTSSAVVPASTSASITSPAYSTVFPMATPSSSETSETLATDPATPASSTQAHKSDQTAVAVAASVSAVVALLLVVGGASYWRRRRLRRRQSYLDYQYPRSSSEKKRAASPPTLFVDISPTNSAYPTPFDSESSANRTSGSHYLSSSFSSVHRSDFFPASPSSPEPQTASTDIISSFPFPSSSMPTLPAISVTLVSPTSAELTEWATAQRLLNARDNDSENPFRTPRESIVSTRSRTVLDRPTGARPLHSRTPSLGSLSRAASPPPLHRTASVTRLHSRSASMSNLMGAATRIHTRSATRSSANLNSMYMQRPDTSTSMLSMDESAESSDVSSVPTPTTLTGARANAPAIHEAEEESDEPSSPEETDSPIDPQTPSRSSPRPSPLQNVDPNDFVEPVGPRRALRNRHSASLLTQASGVSIATLPSYDAGLAAGEWHVAGGRITPTPAYELNLDRERVVSAGGWSTAATHASCDFDSMLAGNTGSWHAAPLMGIFAGQGSH